MPSRHRFWVILAGNTPTAFRADRRDELVPILTQLQRTQDNVSIQWFARGRLWASQIDEHAALKASRHAPKTRTHDWRPGGSHEDPRKRFELTRDEKRARFKRRQRLGPRPPRPAGARPKGGGKRRP